MATIASVRRPQDRTSKRRPFAAWMKRLTNLKSSSTDSQSQSTKKSSDSPSKSKKGTFSNGSIPASGYSSKRIAQSQRGESQPDTNGTGYYSDNLEESNAGVESCSKSMAPTVATNPETIHSDTGQSKAGTSNTVGERLSSVDGGGNSIFSSPNHSSRSLTTTLTTIQSTAPSQLLNQGAPAAGNNPQIMPFTHQYQASQTSTHTSPPPSAIPHHLHPSGNTSANAYYQPNTYASATANNILTDNASVLTLASSSKRHNRRDSFDTGASIRALAPSSAWGGSRESLPLSVLSGVGTIDSSAPPTANGPGPTSTASFITAVAAQQQQQQQGQAQPQRLSYSNASSGPATDTRTGYYSTPGVASTYNPQKERFADGSSVRSGLVSHSRADSTSGVASPIAAVSPPARAPSRRSLEWVVPDGGGDGTAEKELGGEGDAAATAAAHVAETAVEKDGAAAAEARSDAAAAVP